MYLVITVASFSTNSVSLSINRWKPVLSEKTKLGVGSSIMVSGSKDDHFQKHCTVV